jgi:hypothetical protein
MRALGDGALPLSDWTTGEASEASSGVTQSLIVGPITDLYRIATLWIRDCGWLR